MEEENMSAAFTDSPIKPVLCLELSCQDKKSFLGSSCLLTYEYISIEKHSQKFHFHPILKHFLSAQKYLIGKNGSQ